MQRTGRGPLRPLMAGVLLAILAARPHAQSPGPPRLAPADRAAFTAWFTLIADSQFEAPSAEVVDCASLVRLAFREALRPHTPEWARRTGLAFHPRFPDVASGPRPTNAGWPLFQISPGPQPRFGEFADARTIIALNTRPLGRHLAALRPGDLIYFRQPRAHQPDHLMVFVGPSRYDGGGDDWVVYHTGPDDRSPGEIRKVRLADLRRHPSPAWRPLPDNAAFVGVFRWSVL